MLLTLKKEQSVKLKISIVFIWFIAMMIIVNALYDGYLMYVGEYQHSEFGLVSPYVFMAFGVLVAVGLLFGSKVARGLILLLSYVPLVGTLYYLLVNDTAKNVPSYMFILGIGFYVLTIYLLSHEDILKVFKVKSLKTEILFYVLLSVIFYMLFTWYMKSMTEDIDLELTLKDNIVEYIFSLDVTHSLIV